MHVFSVHGLGNVFQGEYIGDMSLLVGTLLVCDNDNLPRWRNNKEEKGE